MRSRAAGLLLAASLLAPFSIAGAQTPLKDAYLKRFVGKPAPPLVLKDMKGVPVKLSDYRGRVVLLNFWGATRGPVFESSVRPYLEARAAATPGRVTPSVP